MRERGIVMDIKDRKITDLVKQVALLERKMIRLKREYTLDGGYLKGAHDGMKAHLAAEQDRNDEIDYELTCVREENEANKESVKVAMARIVVLEDEKLVEVYNSVLATVLPSVDTDMYGRSWRPSPELLGLILLESMACETPVIASSAGGMPEVVLEGKTGFLVPPSDVTALADRLCWIAENYEAVRRMGRESRKWVMGNFTWDKVARRCLSAYDSILAS